MGVCKMWMSFRRNLNFIIIAIFHFQHFLEGRGVFGSEFILSLSIHFAELNSSPLSKRLSF